MTGKELRQIRRQMRLSRRKLGELLGVHGNTINKWERGDRPISQAMARLIQLVYQQESSR